MNFRVTALPFEVVCIVTFTVTVPHCCAGTVVPESLRVLVLAARTAVEPEAAAAPAVIAGIARAPVPKSKTSERGGRSGFIWEDLLDGCPHGTEAPDKGGKADCQGLARDAVVSDQWPAGHA